MNTLAADVRPAKIARDHTLTRRAALSALSVGIASATLMPGIAGADPTNRMAWAHAVALYRRLDAEYAVASTAFSDAQGAYFDRAQPAPVFTLEMEGDYGRFGKHVLPLTILHSELDDPARTWREPERIDAFRQTLADYRTKDAALRHELRVDELDAEQIDAMRRQSDALAALIALPAPDMVALAQKLEIILAEYDDEGDGVTAVLADVRRLSVREG